MDGNISPSAGSFAILTFVWNPYFKGGDCACRWPTVTLFRPLLFDDERKFLAADSVKSSVGSLLVIEQRCHLPQRCITTVMPKAVIIILKISVSRVADKCFVFIFTLYIQKHYLINYSLHLIENNTV